MKIRLGYLRRRQEELQELTSCIEADESKFLRQNGWKYTCDTPGSVWLWEKTLTDGRTMLLSHSQAVSWAERDAEIEANNRKWIAGEHCPQCDTQMEFDAGDPGGVDEPPTPASIYCHECGSDYQVDFDRQSAAENCA